MARFDPITYRNEPPVAGYTDVLSLTLAPVEIPGVNAAPAAVFFEVTNVTGCDAPDPIFPQVRIPKYHDITYVWDMGDAAHSTPWNAANLNMPLQWKNLNRAYGMRVAHVYQTPGPKTVRVWAYERSSGKMGSATFNFTIGDPKDVFPGNRTIIYDPSNTGDPANYPSAAVRTTWNDVLTARDAVSAQTAQILLAPGVTLPRQRLINDEPWANIRMGALDLAGAMPVILSPLTEGHAVARDYNETKIEHIFWGIDFQGDWDAATETGVISSILDCFNVSVPTVLTMFHRCNASGWGVLSGPRGIGASSVVYLVHSQLNVTNWQDYGLHGALEPNGFCAVIACGVHQHEDARSGGPKDLGFYNQHGPFRMFSGSHTHIRSSSFFSRNGWSNGSGGVDAQAGYNTTADQPGLRFNTDGTPGFRAHVDRVFIEGGIGFEEQGGAPVDLPCNIVLDKFIQVNGSRTFENIEARHSGLTFLNGYGYFVDRPKAQGNGLPKWIFVSNEDGDAANDDGIVVQNCTVVDWRSNANADNAGFTLVLNDTVEDGIGGSDLMLNVTVENNIVHRPNRVPADVPDTLDLSQSLGVILRHKGPRYGNWFEVGTLAADVPPGGFFPISYAVVVDGVYNFSNVRAGNPTSKAFWDAAAGPRHKMNMGALRLHSELLQFTVEFEPSEIRIRNPAGGSTWAAGTAWTLKLDRRNNLPSFNPIFSSVGIDLKVPRPTVPGTQAPGRRTHDDFFGIPRPATGDTRGAVLP